MGQPKIVEVNYHEFRVGLKKAANTGIRVEPQDTADWHEYVQAHKVNEVAMASWGKSKYGSVVPVIITSGKWSGYYVFSSDEEGCLKWSLEIEEP